MLVEHLSPLGVEYVPSVWSLAEGDYRTSRVKVPKYGGSGSQIPSRWYLGKGSKVKVPNY